MKNKQQAKWNEKIDSAYVRAGEFLLKVSLPKKLIAFAIFLLILSVGGSIAGWNFNRTCVITQFMLVAIPFAVIQNERLKRKYHTKLLSIGNPFVMGVSGVVMLIPIFLGKLIPIKFFKWLWHSDTTLFLSVPAYGLCLLIGYLIISKSVEKTMKKCEFPLYEIKLTTVLLYFVCGWIGALIAWGLLLAIICVALVIVYMIFVGGLTSGGKTAYKNEQIHTWTEGYDEFGDKVYDSRED